jgi:hypothetical protein
MTKIFFAVLICLPFAASAKWVKATDYPPPGHSCDDLYRSRDLPGTYGGLYVDDNAVAVSQPIYCTPQELWVPRRFRDRS